MTRNVSWMPPRWLAWTLAAVALVAAGYGLWWRHAAGLLETLLSEFRANAQKHGMIARWDDLATSGFPLRLRANLTNPRFEKLATHMSWEAQGLTVEMLPWSLTQLNLAVRGPQTLRLGPAIQMSGEAKESGVSLLFRSDGMPKQLDIAAKAADATVRLDESSTIGVKGDVLAFHWRIDPEDTNTQDGRDYDVAINGKSLTLTGVDMPFGPDIADLKLQLTLRNVPALKGVDGAMDIGKWQMSGAPVTIRKLTFVSGGVDIQGAGDLALNAEGVLQGELALTVGGLDKVVELMSKRGAIPPEAKTTLFVTSTMLSATGAKVPMPLVFKDGKMLLGPAEIGPAPRIVF